MKKSYKVKFGVNQYRVYHWDSRVECYREGTDLLAYSQACEAVRAANKRQ